MKHTSFLAQAIFFCFFLYYSPLMAQQSVTWTDTVGISISGDNVTSTAPSGWGNSGAASSKMLDYTINGWVEITAVETNTSKMFGLSKINTDADYQTIDFAIQLTQNGLIRVYESGSLAYAYSGSYQSGDKFKVERNGDQIRYLKNGNLFYTSSKASNSQLLVDFAINHIGTNLEDIQVSNSFEDLSNGTNTDPSASGVIQLVDWTDIVGLGFIESKIVKIGTSSWGNGGAASSKKLDFTVDGWLQIKARETSTSKMFGLSKTNIDADYQTIDYAIQLTQNNLIRVYENGNLTHSNNGSYQSGDVFKVERVGDQIRYSQNDSVFHTSSKASNSPLVADFAMNHNGTSLDSVQVSNSFENLDNGTNTDPDGPGVTQLINWKDIVGLGFRGSKIIKIGSTELWDTGAASLETLPDGTNGWVEVTAREVSTGKMFGLSQTNTDADYQSINYAIQLSQNGLLRIYENGVLVHSNSSLYQSGDVFRVERIANQISYQKNGSTFYTSSQSSDSELIVDFSMKHSGASIENVVVSNSFQIPITQGQFWAKKLSTIYTVDNVAIGTDTPIDGHVLSVRGKIATQGVKVTMNGWADFVFKNDYDLKSLKELQKFIEDNGHLPDIPKTQEVLENGIYLGEMNKLLLQKVEELTLYLLQQNERIEKLEKKLNKKGN